MIEPGTYVMFHALTMKGGKRRPARYPARVLTVISEDVLELEVLFSREQIVDSKHPIKNRDGSDGLTTVTVDGYTGRQWHVARATNPHHPESGTWTPK